MSLIFIDGLPLSVRKGGILRLVIEEGRVEKGKIGRIVLGGGMATVEVDEGSVERAVQGLNGSMVGGKRVAVWQEGVEGGHFEKLLRWLNLESEAERRQGRREGEKRGRLSRLVVQGEEIGLGGRVLLQLAPKNQQATLPFSRLNGGSPIVLSVDDSDKSWRGVVSRKTKRWIEIALNREPELEGGESVSIAPSSDEVGRQRMVQALSRASSAKGRLGELRDVLLGVGVAESNPTPYTQIAELNASQNKAVEQAMNARDIAIIHGPPGTGKTTTVAALIQAAVASGESVFASASSNLAVDNMAEKLADAGLRIVRIGHPVRVMPNVQPFTLDALVEKHSDYKMAKKLHKEAAGLRRDAGKFRRARPEQGARQAMRSDARDIVAEARQLEDLAVERVLDEAQVVLATLTAIDSRLLGQREFDLCVIDEAGQATEPASWIPIVRSKRLVLAGDHLQLPPTIISQQAQEEGFGISLMERLMGTNAPSTMLDVQYRMNSVIMGFNSAEFYPSLTAHSSVKNHLLSHLPNVTETPLTTTPPHLH